MYCEKCGNKLEDTAKFCTKCGEAIHRAEPEKEKFSEKQGLKQKKILTAVCVAAVLVVCFFAFTPWGKNYQFKQTLYRNDYVKAYEMIEKLPNERDVYLDWMKAVIEEQITDYNKAKSICEQYAGMEEMKPVQEMLTERKEEIWIEASEAFLRDECGLIEESELYISEEDIVYENDYYYVDNPDAGKYQGVVSSKETDLDGDGEKELWTLELEPYESDMYGVSLRGNIRMYAMDEWGAFTEKHLLNYDNNNLSFAVSDLWEDTPNHMLLNQNTIDVTLMQGWIDSKPYMFVASSQHDDDGEYFELGIYGKGTENNFYLKEYYSLSLYDGFDLYEFDTNVDGVKESALASSDGDEFLEKSFTRPESFGITLERYAGNWEWRWNESFEEIGSVHVYVDDLKKDISGYYMSLEGNVIKEEPLLGQKDLDAEETIEYLDVSRGAITLRGTLEYRVGAHIGNEALEKKLYVLHLDPAVENMRYISYAGDEGYAVTRNVTEIDVNDLHWDEETEGMYDGCTVQVTGEIFENLTAWWFNSFSISTDEVVFE